MTSVVVMPLSTDPVLFGSFRSRAKRGVVPIVQLTQVSTKHERVAKPNTMRHAKFGTCGATNFANETVVADHFVAEA
jgi:hypothetical protein